MPVNILMPALSPTMEKGNLARWLKKEGDRVKPGDVIAEIETDKATMEYEAVDEGTIAKIVVPEGTADVPVNQVIAVLAGEGEDVKSAAAGAGKASAPKQPAAPVASHPKEQARAARPATPMGDGDHFPVAGRKTTLGDGDYFPTATSNRAPSSPLARRLAREAGIEISRIAGSGPHG